MENPENFCVAWGGRLIHCMDPLEIEVREISLSGKADTLDGLLEVLEDIKKELGDGEFTRTSYEEYELFIKVFRKETPDEREIRLSEVREIIAKTESQEFQEYKRLKAKFEADTGKRLICG